MIECKNIQKGGKNYLVLASGSVARIHLLAQIGVTPDCVMASNIDETSLPGEHPRCLAKRLAQEKAYHVYQKFCTENIFSNPFVLAADTVVALGRRILPKAETYQEALYCLNLLSGRSHRVYSAVCLITPPGIQRIRLIETRIRFKRLSEQEKQAYLETREWQEKAGGYAAQGFAASFIVKIIGSYTNIVGLPLYETVNLLRADGFPVLSSLKKEKTAKDS